jgi:hypothetical protein
MKRVTPDERRTKLEEEEKDFVLIHLKSSSEWTHLPRKISYLFLILFIRPWTPNHPLHLPLTFYRSCLELISRLPFFSYAWNPPKPYRLEISPSTIYARLILRAYSRHRGQLPLSEPHPDVWGHCVLESTKRASFDSIFSLV